MCKQLVWDYKYGEIICIETGEVVGRIYDYSPITEDDAWRQLILDYKARRSQPLAKAMTITYKKYREKIKIYKRLLRLEKSLGKEYVVDEEKYMEIHLSKKNQVYTIMHKRSVEIKTTKEDEELIQKGIEYLSEKAPHLLAKTLRGKKALGYIVAYLLLNKKPDKHKIMEKFNISETTYKRLLRQAKTVVPQL